MVFGILEEALQNFRQSSRRVFLAENFFLLKLVKQGRGFTLGIENQNWFVPMKGQRNFKADANAGKRRLHNDAVGGADPLFELALESSALGYALVADVSLAGLENVIGLDPMLAGGQPVNNLVVVSDKRAATSNGGSEVDVHTC